MLNVDSLKKVYAALGGDTASVADIDQNAELIEKIADVAGGDSGGVFVVTFDDEKTTADKTYAEILEAYNNNAVIIFRDKNIYQMGFAGFAYMQNGDGSPDYFLATSSHPANYTQNGFTITFEKLTLNANNVVTANENRYTVSATKN